MFRIIGGVHRGRRLEFPVSPSVRPMTDRVREAMFNLLHNMVGGRPVLDLFAGSGAIGLEALSRGATRATFVEANQRTAELLRRNIKLLEYESCTQVIVADVYRWTASGPDWPKEPALLFVAPPYAHFGTRMEDLRGLLRDAMSELPADSAIAVQAPTSISQQDLPLESIWELRKYGDTHLLVCQTRLQDGPGNSG